jgi:hypothetical protein
MIMRESCYTGFALQEFSLALCTLQRHQLNSSLSPGAPPYNLATEVCTLKHIGLANTIHMRLYGV